MKTVRKRFGTIILGTVIILAGCGGGQTDETSGTWSVETGSSGAEVNAQTEYEQGGQGQSSQGQNILTLGTCESPWELTYAVEAYNARNGKYYVEIVDYGQEYQDYDTVRERLKLDLATLKGTDIIWVGDLVADELGYAGVLADLNVYLTSENREKYLTHILEHAKTGDALYEIASTFSLEFIAGDSRKLGTETGWTMEDMLETFRVSNKDANALGGVGVYTAQELVLHAIEDFVDWDAGRANFCNQEFYDILEFSRNESGWVKTTQESVASGTHLAVRSGISDVTSIQYTNWLLGTDDWVVKGWPCNQGTGVKVSFWNSFAVSSYSQCLEGTWDFLEYYMTLDWLEEYAALHPDLPPKTYASIHGLPLNRLAFEKMLEWSTVQRYYDTGEPVPFYFGEEGIPDLYANSAEDVERIREIVTLADGKSLSNLSFVSQIIGEEISGYKAAVFSAEQTADKIQNRVQLYLNEYK